MITITRTALGETKSHCFTYRKEQDKAKHPRTLVVRASSGGLARAEDESKEVDPT